VQGVEAALRFPEPFPPRGNSRVPCRDAMVPRTSPAPVQRVAMKIPDKQPAPEVSAEQLAMWSITAACSSADRYINKLAPGVSAMRQNAFLQEIIYFHHFSAMCAVFLAFHHGLKSRDAYCDRMVAAIHSGIPLTPNEELGFAPLTVFSAKDVEDAVKSCFFSFANLDACSRQRLYLQGEQSKAELKVMNLRTVREMTGWDSPSANPEQYLTAALIARLIISLEIEPPEHVLEFFDLSSFAVAESLAAFELYVRLLGGGVGEAPKAKGNWFSRLFK